MKNEKGFVLVICLMLFLVVTLLATATIQTGVFGNMIAGNGLESQKAFWIAESGIEDARAKLCGVENVESFKAISGLTNPVPYAGGKYTLAVFDDPYGPSRVIVRSVGVRDGGASKTVESVIQKFTFGLPGALYAKAHVGVNSDKTTIDGNDPCGGQNRPSIITFGSATVDFQNGNLYGNGMGPVTDATDVKYGSVTELGSTHNYPLQQYVNAFKDYATNTDTDGTIPGSHIGNDWGGDDLNIISPVDGVAQRIQLYGDPEPNVIYLDPPVNAATGKKDVSLTGQVSGHGLLLVNGALSIEGGFNWYGLIIATGGVKFTGSGGQDKNITGAVMAGETGVLVDTTITGAVNLLYCSYVTNYLRDLPSAIMLSWKEIKG